MLDRKSIPLHCWGEQHSRSCHRIARRVPCFPWSKQFLGVCTLIWQDLHSHDSLSVLSPMKGGSQQGAMQCKTWAQHKMKTIKKCMDQTELP